MAKIIPISTALEREKVPSVRDSLHRPERQMRTGMPLPFIHLSWLRGGLGKFQDLIQTKRNMQRGFGDIAPYSHYIGSDTYQRIAQFEKEVGKAKPYRP